MGTASRGRALYRFRWDCGRQWRVEGTFTAKKKDVDAAIGKRVSFGEILGKYSDVNGTLDREDIELLTDDKSFVSKFDELKCESGYNPLQYISDN